MKVALDATLRQVQIKPGADNDDPPIMKIVLEVSGSDGAEDLAMFLGKTVNVEVASAQMRLDELLTVE